MSHRPRVVLVVVLVAAGGLLATGPQKSTPSPAGNAAEAARLNNLGAAYMNQQLFEKALKNFEAAAKLDPGLKIAEVNRGIALLNLQRVLPQRALEAGYAFRFSTIEEALGEIF